MAGVKVEIYTNRLIERLNASLKDTFLKDITDESRLVKNDVIHLADVGADPEVLINNTTYPIESVQRADNDIAISLDKFDTKNTKVTDDELYAIAYDKIDSVIKGHVNAMTSAIIRKYIHAIAPASDSANTPIIKTSGATKGGVKMLMPADILDLKQKFDDLEIPEDQRVLVLSSDHHNQLLALDQKFAGQYYDAQRGGVMPIFYGFKMDTYVATPGFHTNGTTGKLAFGAVSTANHRKASVAFWTGGVFKATGTTEMYYRDAKTNPEYRESVVGFRNRGICLPIKTKNVGAIISVA